TPWPRRYSAVSRASRRSSSTSRAAMVGSALTRSWMPVHLPMHLLDVLGEPAALLGGQSVVDLGHAVHHLVQGPPQLLDLGIHQLVQPGGVHLVRLPLLEEG